MPKCHPLSRGNLMLSSRDASGFSLLCPQQLPKERSLLSALLNSMTMTRAEEICPHSRDPSPPPSSRTCCSLKWGPTRVLSLLKNPLGKDVGLDAALTAWPRDQLFQTLKKLPRPQRFPFCLFHRLCFPLCCP